jgi:hypothetical protein
VSCAGASVRNTVRWTVSSVRTLMKVVGGTNDPTISSKTKPKSLLVLLLWYLCIIKAPPTFTVSFFTNHFQHNTYIHQQNNIESTETGESKMMRNGLSSTREHLHEQQKQQQKRSYSQHQLQYNNRSYHGDNCHADDDFITLPIPKRTLSCSSVSSAVMVDGQLWDVSNLTPPRHPSSLSSLRSSGDFHHCIAIDINDRSNDDEATAASHVMMRGSQRPIDTTTRITASSYPTTRTAAAAAKVSPIVTKPLYPSCTSINNDVPEMDVNLIFEELDRRREHAARLYDVEDDDNDDGDDDDDDDDIPPELRLNHHRSNELERQFLVIERKPPGRSDDDDDDDDHHHYYYGDHGDDGSDSFTNQQQQQHHYNEVENEVIEIIDPDRETMPALTIEVSPGFFLPLKGQKETERAVGRGQVKLTQCMCCEQHMYCITSVDYVICPHCDSILPVDFGGSCSNHSSNRIVNDYVVSSNSSTSGSSTCNSVNFHVDQTVGVGLTADFLERALS